MSHCSRLSFSLSVFKPGTDACSCVVDMDNAWAELGRTVFPGWCLFFSVVGFACPGRADERSLSSAVEAMRSLTRVSNVFSALGDASAPSAAILSGGVVSFGDPFSRVFVSDSARIDAARFLPLFPTKHGTRCVRYTPHVPANAFS